MLNLKSVYTLSIGMNHKDTYKPFMSESDFIELVKEHLKDLPGYSLYTMKGGYTMENGTFINENSVRVELIDIKKKALKQIVENLKAACCQESILVQHAIKIVTFA